ncbi:MAG: protein BatD [Chlorobiales bacterium]|nr:protein BatD [Chlorobiales bacterium]
MGIKKLIYRTLLFFAVLTVASQRLMAEQGKEPSASVKISPDTCTVGDDITYLLTISSSPSVSVSLPIAGDTSFVPFEIRSAKQLSKEDAGGQVITKMEYTLAVFETGQQALPALNLSYIDDKQGAVTGSIQIPGKTIFVKSLLDTSRKDIEDIKPVQSLPFPVWIYFAVAGAIIALGLIGYFIYRKMKNKKEEPPAAPPAPERSPYEVAREKLVALEHHPLEAQEDCKQYYIKLSDTLREFLQANYGFNALDQLTSEIYTSLEKRAGRAKAELVDTILERADLVKFAKFYPSRSDAKESLAQSLQAIENAKPGPIEVSSSAEAAPKTTT